MQDCPKATDWLFLDAVARVVSIHTSPVASFGWADLPSGFVKRRVLGSVHVGRLGLEGDEEIACTVHGNPDKAVYGYALSSYSLWRCGYRRANPLTPGDFGENLTIAGLDETTVCIGDIVRIGTSTLQVSQPREPCLKPGPDAVDPHLPDAIMNNGRCGWYYRVLVEGVVGAGDVIALRTRPNPDWTVARFHRLIAGDSVTLGEMAELAELDGLAIVWRRKAWQAIANRPS